MPWVVRFFLIALAGPIAGLTVTGSVWLVWRLRVDDEWATQLRLEARVRMTRAKKFTLIYLWAVALIGGFVAAVFWA